MMPFIFKWGYISGFFCGFGMGVALVSFLLDQQIVALIGVASYLLGWYIHNETVKVEGT